MEDAIRTSSASQAEQSSSSSDTDIVESSAKRNLDPPESATNRSNKRAKKASFERHTRFWALDGNAILRFRHLNFKVHRSRLSTQSVWFKKLFERRAGRKVPLDDDEEDIKKVVVVQVEDMDGCDVYHFPSTRRDVSDFEALLNAMEDSMCVARSPQLIDL
jgi:hypothetical protein